MIDMRALLNLFESTLDEMASSPSRLVTHVREGKPFFMISAFRADLPRSENMKRDAMLRSKLTGFELTAYLRTTGEYQEIGQDKPSRELSYFVLPKRDDIDRGRFVDFASALQKAFNQDSIIIGDGEKIWLSFSPTDRINLGDAVTFRMDLIDKAEGFSIMRGRKFTFTGQDDAPYGVPYGKPAGVIDAPHHGTQKNDD